MFPFFKKLLHSNILESEEKFMSKLKLGTGKFAANQLEEISELMAAQLNEQNERVSEMVWSSKCLLEAGFIISNSTECANL